MMALSIPELLWYKSSVFVWYFETYPDISALIKKKKEEEKEEEQWQYHI